MTASAIRYLSKDPLLSKVIDSVSHEFAKPSGTVYEGLLSSICSQQLSVKAAETIHGRFLNLFGGSPQPQALLATPVDELRAVGLSYRKASYVHNVAQFFTEKKLQDANWDAYKDEDIIEILTEIKGVGRWTVQMILMFELGRPDVMPLDDLGIQKAMIELYELKTVKKELRHMMEQIAADMQGARCPRLRTTHKKIYTTAAGRPS